MKTKILISLFKDINTEPMSTLVPVYLKVSSGPSPEELKASKGDKDGKEDAETVQSELNEGKKKLILKFVRT